MVDASAPFQPPMTGNNPVTPAIQQGPTGAIYQVLLQELVKAVQQLAVYTQQNSLQQTASGDISGNYPGPINVTGIDGQSALPVAWTPTDASGVGLVFTNVSASYTRLGNMVFAYGTLTYPATVSAVSAKIGGLPFNAANQGYANTPCPMVNNSGTFGTQGFIVQNTSSMEILDVTTGVQKTNAQLSGFIVRFTVAYPVA